MILTLEHISHRYGELEVLKQLSLEVKAGQFVALTGPSGSGKTTLLQIAGLLDVPSEGRISLGGKDAGHLSERDRTLLRRTQIGFIYQFHHLLPEFTALENVLMPLLIAGKITIEARQRASILLERVGLSARAQHRPGELSGGERQRVAICRALIHQPKLILADEPTGNLDEASAQNVFTLFMELARSSGAGILVATHNLALAAQMDAAYRLQGGQVEKA